MRKTVNQRAAEIIAAVETRAAAHIWRDNCFSDSAFLATWHLGREGRRLAGFAAKSKKTQARGAARGLVVVRHAAIAVEKLLKKMKSAKRRGGAVTETVAAWANKAVNRVVSAVLRRNNQNRQLELFA